SLAQAGEDAVDDETGRRRFGALFLLSWLAITYLAGTFQSAGVSDLQLPLLPMVLLVIGAYLDEALAQTEPLPFAGLVVALGAVILGRDFFLFPESYVGAHISESI